MTREDAGKYSAKHASGATPNPETAAALTSRALDDRVSCTDAMTVATELGVSPAEVGKTLDLLEYRIVRCQLGLFGYSPQKRIVKPAEHVTDEVRDELERRAADGEISCASCWSIADTLSIERMEVSSACERLGIKIRHCQLGAF